jgi:glycosyltransferase involved in cell wall biosynthesis
MRLMDVVAVVPSYREQTIIGDTVTSLRSLGIERVVVVDDASDDLTARNASEAGAVLVVHGRNLGKGSSLNMVLPHLAFDALLLIDGDLGIHASQARLLLEPILSGEADLAIASFGARRRKGGFGLARGLGRRGIEWLVGRTTESPLSGQRAMTGEVYRAVAPFAPGFGMEVAMTVDALRAGFRVIEVATEMSHRETGRDMSGFMHRGRQFADIARALAVRAPGWRRD